jgi:predicted tellurium resistance membrane protein TerC
LIGGGVFLIAKSADEIHNKLEGATQEYPNSQRASRLGWLLAQIVVLDIIFSLDSVITTVGMRGGSGD